MTQQEINKASMLPIGAILRGIYRVDKHLSSGGFGNTYMVTNIEFNERYAIKEFFMKGITQRDGNQTTVSVSNSENGDTFLQQKEKFKKEARRLRQLDNPHIVKVHDLFEENGTAYYVMDYIDGVNLREYLAATGRAMNESEVKLILPQILDALKVVHEAGMWHLDLKPANIMLEKGGNIKLLDFGASKQIDVKKGGATTDTSITYTPGYAPLEQMEQNYDKFGPWTDFYALGATLYALLTNKQEPPKPTDIVDDISEDKHVALPMPADISKQLRDLVLWLMQTNRLRRPQTITDVQQKLNQIEGRIKSTSNTKEVILNQNPSMKDSHNIVDEGTIISSTNDGASSKNLSTASSPTVKTTLFRQGCLGLFLLALLLMSFGAYILFDRFQEKKKNGYFVETYEDGSKYVGNFKNGLYEGKGTYVSSNGEQYYGEWKNGIPMGQGTYIWPEERDGYMCKYVGEFKNGVFDGKGTAFYVGGVSQSGVWENGNLIRLDNSQKSTSSPRGMSASKVKDDNKIEEGALAQDDNNLEEDHYYYVLINCGVPNARISIDGRSDVQLGGLHKLSPGRHDIVIRAKDHYDLVRTIHVDDDSKIFNFKMTPIR